MTRNPYFGASQESRRGLLEQRAWDDSEAGRIKRSLDRGFVDAPMRSRVDLRKIREGIGLTPQYVAALAGITDMTLLGVEDRMEDTEMVEEILAVLALYMATRWGAEILNLTEANLTETSS